MQNLYCDLETFSPTPIKYGSHKYAEQAEVMLFAYAMGDGDVKVWDCTQDPVMPADLAGWLNNPDVMTVWHNGGNFDTVVLNHCGVTLPLDRVHDTMIQAYQHSLPGSLGALCEIFKIEGDDAKDKDGKKLIQLFCKPRPKTSKLRRATRETHPHEWARFKKYAGSDIRAMRQLHRKIPKWNCTTKEINLWRLDQHINRRGVGVDLDLAHGAIAAIEIEKADLAKRTRVLTNEEVESATKRDALLAWICAEYGVTLPDMQSATLERRINDPDLPAPLRELLSIRLSATTSSTAKYKTLINSASSDARLRGLLQFCGAMRTGRWAGRIWQPQNLPRPTLKADAISAAICAFVGGYADLVIDDIMAAASSSLRGCIIPSAGRKLCVSDLSNIEGRLIAWLAGEHWKIKAFGEADAGTGPDLYILAYAKAFGLNWQKVNKDQRQTGKVLELSMGFGGGVGALAAMAMAYNMPLEEMAASVLSQVDAQTLADARGLREWMDSKGQLNRSMPEHIWLACDCLKRLWRAAHPAICALWAAVEKAAKAAINGTPTITHGLSFEKRGAWLRIRLPSGRYLCYPSPRIVDGTITYMGVSPYSRKWVRLKTFGGKLVENIIQAMARDVLAENMPAIEAAGYPIVLTVHDEVITEPLNEPRFNVNMLSSLLANVPTWARGLPLSAAGFEAMRYRKD